MLLGDGPGFWPGRTGSQQGVGSAWWLQGYGLGETPGRWLLCSLLACSGTEYEIGKYFFLWKANV